MRSYVITSQPRARNPIIMFKKMLIEVRGTTEEALQYNAKLSYNSSSAITNVGLLSTIAKSLVKLMKGFRVGPGFL